MKFKFLNEMAYKRKDALDKLGINTKEYTDHLIKCIIYKNVTGSLWHWCDELANYISIINDIKLKPDNSKFDPKTYEDEFFLANGDTERDYEIDLIGFQKSYRFKYPRFEVTPELISKTYNTFMDISNFFSNHISKNNSHKKEWFRNALLDYFEEEINED